MYYFNSLLRLTVRKVFCCLTMKLVRPIVKRSSAGKLWAWSETEVMTVFVTGTMNDTTPTPAQSPGTLLY